MIGLPDPFLLRAALAGLGVAVAAAPLGCHVHAPKLGARGSALPPYLGA